MTITNDSTDDELVDAARDQYGTGEISIDVRSSIDIMRTNDGAWIKAWVYVEYDKEN